MNSIDRGQELAFLLKVARAINGPQSTEEALQTFAHLIHDYFRPEAVSIACMEAGGSLVFCAASGEGAESIVGTRIPAGMGIAGWVAQHRRRLWVPEAYKDSRFYAEVDQRTGFTTRAVLAVPMEVRGELLAVLEFINPQSHSDIDTVGDMVYALALFAAPIIQTGQLRERVSRAERRYQRLFMMDPDPLVILDSQGKILETNRAAQAVLDIGLDAGTSPRLTRLGIAEGTFAGLSRKARDGQASVWEYELPESGRMLEAHLSHLSDYATDADSYLWSAHDITDRVRLERTRQELVHMIVHDLRVPLGNILNSLDLVLTAWQEKDLTLPTEQVLEIGLRSAHRMERLVNDILDSARIQASEHRLSVARIDVAAMIKEAIEAVTPSAEHRDQTVTSDVPSDLPTLEGDPDLLQRVLVNLLSNAVKYTQKEGDIEVHVDADDKAFRFTVTDNGPGIAPEFQEHIFDLFFRGDTGQTRGAGIGLAFCKLAVEAHGGRIWLESELGKGTTFTFTVPRVLPEHAPYYEESKA